MTLDEAARRLAAMYHDPATGKVVSIHLFGITYAEAIDGMSLEEVVVGAGLNKSYQTEVRKGMNLARYVSIK
jgi:hypothetical protein